MLCRLGSQVYMSVCCIFYSCKFHPLRSAPAVSTPANFTPEFLPYRIFNSLIFSRHVINVYKFHHYPSLLAPPGIEPATSRVQPS